MNNFLFGIEAIFKLVRVELSVLFYSQIVRGFFLGYIVATLIYAYIVAGKRKNK